MAVWLCSDTHFSHRLLVPHRQPWLGCATVAEMNEAMADMWADAVAADDRVYHLGDVTFRPAADLPLLAKLPGHKRLIAGNHDTVTATWFKVFKRVRGAQGLGGTAPGQSPLWLTHIPCHPAHIRGTVNVHGHLHHGPVVAPPFSHLYYNINFDVQRRLMVPLDEVLDYARRLVA